MLDHYAQTMCTAARLLDPSDPVHIDPPSHGTQSEPITEQAPTSGLYNPECPVWLALTRYTAGHEYDSHPWPLAWSIAGASAMNGRWHDLITANHAAIQSLQRLGNRRDLAQAYGALALAYGALGQYTEANTQLEHALAMQDELRNTSVSATVHRIACHLFSRQERHREAVHHGRQAVEAFRAIGDRGSQGGALNTVGWSLIQIGEYQQALACCHEALTLHQEVPDPRGEAAAWDSLGYAHHRLGDHPQASDCFHAALGLCRALGSQWNEVGVLLHLGETQYAGGHVEAARTTWHQALTIMREIGHPDTEELTTRLANLKSEA
jgi:tetratricopeptide (TPR) repeat protein